MFLLGKKSGTNPVLVDQWKNLLEKAARAVARDNSLKVMRVHADLLKRIGKLIVERNLLAQELLHSD